jgi:hypothetical protein
MNEQVKIIQGVSGTTGRSDKDKHMYSIVVRKLGSKQITCGDLNIDGSAMRMKSVLRTSSIRLWPEFN